MARDHVVLLAHAHDTGARTVADLLAGDGAPPLVVRPEQLSTARWSHVVDTAGRARTSLTFRNGRSLPDADVACLLNRIEHLPVDRFNGAGERDRDYAAMEMQALVASWLAGLGDRVVNRPTARATDSGPSSDRLWLAAAAAHGLPVRPSAMATSARVLARASPGGGGPIRPLGPWAPPGAGAPTGRVPVEVGEPDAAFDPMAEIVVAGGSAIGPLGDRFGAACMAVAAEAGCRLVGFQFADDGAGPVLQAVTSRPRLAQPWAARAAADLLAALAGAGADAGARPG